MLFKSLKDCAAFVAGDLTEIRELLHPKNEDIDINYSLAHAALAVGASSVPHILQKSSEVYFILEGKGRAFIGDEIVEMSVNDTVLIPAGVQQHIENIGDTPLKFLCVVSPPWSEGQELVLNK